MRDAFRGRPANGLSLRWRRFFLAEPGGLTTRPFRCAAPRGRPQSACEKHKTHGGTLSGREAVAQEVCQLELARRWKEAHASH